MIVDIFSIKKLSCSICNIEILFEAIIKFKKITGRNVSTFQMYPKKV